MTRTGTAAGESVLEQIAAMERSERLAGGEKYLDLLLRHKDLGPGEVEELRGLMRQLGRSASDFRDDIQTAQELQSLASADTKLKECSRIATEVQKDHAGAMEKLKAQWDEFHEMHHRESGKAAHRKNVAHAHRANAQRAVERLRAAERRWQRTIGVEA